MDHPVVDLIVRVVSGAISLGIAALLCWIAYRRIVGEPRRLSNAYWLLAAVVVTISTLSSLGFPGTGVIVWLVGLVIIASPLLILVLTVFLLLNGFTMVRREGRSLGNLLSLLLGLGLAGLIVGTLPAAALVFRGLGWVFFVWTLVVLLAGYFAFHFVAFLGYAVLYPRLVRHRPADWVVVLGSGLKADGSVPPLLASRISTGMAELERRGGRRLVLSGGKGEDERRPEGEAMAEWALQHGADPDTVRRETESRNTEQNLRLSSALLVAEAAPSPGLIVTSNYHVMRAAVLARKIGLNAQAAGAPTAGYYWPSAMIREYVAILREQWRVHATILGGGIGLVALAVIVLELVVHT